MKANTAAKARKEIRNLFIRIPDEVKASLKKLAKKSGMSMEAYVAAVLMEAIENQDTFMFVKKKKEQNNAAPAEA